MSKHVIIIGAGVGGLATANMLAKAGYDVSIYEKNDKPGGRAGTMSEQGFTFDTGPSWYLMPEVFEHYFSLFGESVSEYLDLQRLNPAYKVFFEDDEPLVVTSDLTKDAATFEAVESGAGERLKKYVARGDEIYRLSLQHFLYTNFSSFRDFTSRAVLSRALTMLKLAFTPIDSYVRRFVIDLRLRQILEYPMVFLGSSPFSAPAVYSLMSALDFKKGVYYPRGGLYKIIELLVSIGNDLGVEYHYDAPVRQILTSDGKATGIELEDGTVVTADIVISNADLHFTETQLLAPNARSYPEQYWSKQEVGPSALLMYLGVKGSLPELKHHNLYFVKDWQANFDAIFGDKKIPAEASLYICKPSASDDGVAPVGHENMFVLVPLPAGLSTAANLEDLSEKYLIYIESQLNIPDLRERLVVKKMFGPSDFAASFNAWHGSALGPSHILRQSAMFRTPNKSRKLCNLYYVGGFTAPGIGLPMCLISAELVYKRLAGDKRGGPISSIKRLEDLV